MAAFRAAQQTGSLAIETDIQLTTDGVPVLCHDRLLTRYGHGELCAEECSYHELATLDFGLWFSSQFAGERIVRLEELLAEFGTAFHYHLELKGAHPQLAPATMALVEQHDLWAHCTFTSFSWQQLERAHASAPHARLGWLVKIINDEVLQQASTLPLDCLCPDAKKLNPEDVVRAHTVVPKVRAWGCPTHEQAARSKVEFVQQIGCCGITIDEPLWVEASTALRY